MNMNRCIIIYFDYGGYYSNTEEGYMEWNPSEDRIYSLMMKTSLEDVTYSELVRSICKKMKRDEDATRLKLSYTPKADHKHRPSIIEDDEDLCAYIMTCPNDQSGSILHVEPLEDVAQNIESEEVVRNESAACVNDGVLSIYGEGQMEHGLVNTCENDAHDDEEFVNLDEYYQLGDVVEEGEERGVNEDERERGGNEDGNVAWEDDINVILGQEFQSKGEIQDIVEIAAHKKCFEFDILKSDKERYVVKCHKRSSGCKWNLRAAILKSGSCFSIRTHNKMHTCSPASSSSTRKNRRKGTKRIVASLVNKEFPSTFETPTPKMLVGLVHRKVGVKVSYSTAYRGKLQAASYVRGSPEESFRSVYSFMHNLELINEGTITRVEVDEQHRFQYLFFALGASIEGFRAMRKVIIMDGTFLKHIYGGVLIVATAQDPEHHHYPLAFGVVDGEKDASWTWFLEMLKSVIPDSQELVFLTDRHQSIIKAVSEVYPLAQHGYCMYHLAQNVKGSVHHVKKETVVSMFIECAKAYTEAEFKKLYVAFRKRYPSAGEYLDKSTSCDKWARCYFLGDRYNLMSSNAVESINGVFVAAREYSLLPMLDVIVGKISEWFNKHRKSSAEVPSSHKLVPHLESLLNERLQEANRLGVIEINSYRHEYTVLGLDGITYLVDLAMKTCSCKQFDIDKYPCVHALAANRENVNGEVQVHELCSKYYWMEQWALAYCRSVYPVPHQSQWVIPPEIQEMYAEPPNYKKKKGRNAKARHTSVGEHGNRGRGSSQGSNQIGQGSSQSTRGSSQRGRGWFNCSTTN